MKFTVQKITLMAVLTACSLTIFVIEAQFPLSAVGGIKLGLANIVTLISMVFIGRKEAGMVLLMRIILATAFYGTLMSFAFSIVGGTLAYIAMCLTVKKLEKKQLWAVSVCGGIFHNLGQILVAVAVTGQKYAVGLVPYLVLSGIVTGFFTGITAQALWFSPLRKFALKDKKN